MLCARGGGGLPLLQNYSRLLFIGGAATLPKRCASDTAALKTGSSPDDYPGRTI